MATKIPSRLPPGTLERWLGTGELERRAKEMPEGSSQADFARAIGCTPDAYTCAQVRFRRQGKYLPKFRELRAGYRETATAIDSSIPARGEITSSVGKLPERERWPSVRAFDAIDKEAIEAVNDGYVPPKLLPYRNPEALPYQPPPSPMSRKLTRAECPDGSMILWASDIHIPIHNVIACDLMIECAERNGIRRAILGGDGLDFNCLSRHKKQARRTVEHSTLLEEIAPGRSLLDWFGTKDTDYILGNHEYRLQAFIDENPVFHGSLLSNFAKVVDLPAGINVVPQGGEVRLGNLSARHTDAEFKGGSGGKYPAQRLLDMLPDQSTIGGHVHRISSARRTTQDEEGIKRTRCAWTMGHMSTEHEHYEYMSTSPNWQTGFGMIYVHWEGERPRWTVYQIEVLFDRYNRPYFEFGGHVYSAARKVAA